MDTSLTMLTPEDLADLAEARRRLEYPSFTARLADVLGSPLERGLHRLPKGWQDALHRLAHGVLLKSLEFALVTLGRHSGASHDRLHKTLVGVSGGIGGAVGLAALPIELPISTAIMLRSIADIARSEGHDLRRTDVRLACLEVFALGGPRGTDDAVDTGYWAVRTTLAQALPAFVERMATRRLTREVAEQFSRFIAAIAARFSVVVGESALARTIPAVVGAVAGGVVNVMFINHFQEMARGHFVVLRLEARYGSAVVRAAYEALADDATKRRARRIG